MVAGSACAAAGAKAIAALPFLFFFPGTCTGRQRNDLMPRKLDAKPNRRANSKAHPEFAAKLPPAPFPKLRLPLQPPFAVMEARSAGEIPHAPGWLYEPKWDGFRCLAFRDADTVVLQSKAGQPLTRYFPELVAVLERVPLEIFVLDAGFV